MTSILDLIESAASTEAWAAFSADDGHRMPVEDLWRESTNAADWFSARVPQGGNIAAVLSASSASVTALIGAWRAGLGVVSLPDPARVATPDYQALLRRIVPQTGVDLLVTSPASLKHLPSIAGLTPVSDLATRGGPPGRRHDVGTFIQCTSGSTRSPSGVVLSLEAVANSALAMAERFGDIKGDPVACSWLPLSHDMGLFGGCLSPMVAAGRLFPVTGVFVIDAATFVRRPSVWLKTCSELRASLTMSSPLGLEIATRLAPRMNALDLSSLEVCIVGGELVRGPVTRAFESAHDQWGLGGSVVQPAYGLAENTLAVAIPRMRRPLRPLELDAGSGTQEVLSCGRPVANTEVRIVANGSGQVGEIAIRSNSMFTGYTDGRPRREDSGWFLTGDLGLMADGELYPVGRVDDVIVARGQNLVPTDIEEVAGAAIGRRVGGIAAVAHGNSGYAVVIELPAATSDLDDLESTVRAACARQFGIAPQRVLTVGRGSLPRTASGKLQRRKISARLMRGTLTHDDSFSEE